MMPQKILSLIIPKAQSSAKDFWSPTGLAMGLGENLGQIAVGGLVGGAN